ncbi:hypothetical protein FBU30_009847 [Linnemannia zychae]|nr:hypothetical protein FBU30_009847 [Linnemannia zychae]
MSTRLVIFPTPNPLPPLPPSTPTHSSAHSSSASTSSSSPSPSSSSLLPSLPSTFRPFSHSSPIPSHSRHSSYSSSSTISSVSISIFSSPSPPDVDLIYTSPFLFTSASESASTSCLPIASSRTTSSLGPAFDSNNHRLSTSSSFPPILPPPAPFVKHYHNQHSFLRDSRPAVAATTAASSTTTTTTSPHNYGTNPGAFFSVRNVNVDSHEFLSHLPSQSQAASYSPYQLDSSQAASASKSGYRHHQTRRHLQELAQEQYRQNLQLSLSADSEQDGYDDDDEDNDGIDDQEQLDETQYRLEAMQEPFIYTRYRYNYLSRGNRSGREPERPRTTALSPHSPSTQPPTHRQDWNTPPSPLPPVVPRLITPTVSSVSPSLTSSRSTLSDKKKSRLPTPRSFNCFARLFKRLSRFSCACGPYSSKQQSSRDKSKSDSSVYTESYSSIYLPSQLTNDHSLSSVSTDVSGSLPSIYHHRPQHPGSKRHRQKKAAAAASASATAVVVVSGASVIESDQANYAPSRQDKGKQRAESYSNTESMHKADEQPRDQSACVRSQNRYRRQQTRYQSSLSLSTIHSWCPYCYKTIPSPDQSDHHSRHHFHNLISPTRAPLRIRSGSSSRSSSCSSLSHHYSLSYSPYPQQHTYRQQQQQRSRTISTGSVRSSVLFLSDDSYLSSDDEQGVPLAAQSTPDTLFTFAHPLPHLAESKLQASNTEIRPALTALTPTTAISISATGATLTPATLSDPCAATVNYPAHPIHPKRTAPLLSLSLSPSSSSSFSPAASSSSSSQTTSPPPPQRLAPLPPHPHPQLVVSACTPSDSFNSLQASAGPVVVVRRSKSARASPQPHRLPQESKLEVSGNRFLFVSPLDNRTYNNSDRTTTAKEGSSSLVPIATSSPLPSLSSSPPRPHSSSQPFVSLPPKDAPLPPLPSKRLSTPNKKRPLSWAFPSPSSFCFTNPYKTKQDKHSNSTTNQESSFNPLPTTAAAGTTSNFAFSSQQQQYTTPGSTPLVSPVPFPCLAPPPPPLFIQFLRGLETNPWFSDPSITDKVNIIRDIYPHFGSGSGGGGTIGGIPTGNSLVGHSHLKSGSFDDPSSAFVAGGNSAKRRSWTTFFPFRSRRSSMPAATLSATTSTPSAGMIPTSPSTSAVYQHSSQYSNQLHYRNQSQPLYPASLPPQHLQQQQQQQYHQLPPLQHDPPQKKRSAFKRFSAPAPTRKVEVLTIQQQQALLPASPNTPNYPPVSDTPVAATARNRNSVIYDPNKPLPAIVAEEENDEDHSGLIIMTPPLDEQQQQQLPASVPVATATPSQGQSHLPHPLSLPASHAAIGNVEASVAPSSQQPHSASSVALPIVTVELQQQQQQQQQQQSSAVVVTKKHPRRKSFLPASLMTSNLAKFIGGTSSTNNSYQVATSPTILVHAATGPSSGGPTMSSSNGASTAAIGGAGLTGGGQGQGGMGGTASTTLSPPSLWSSRSPGSGDGESFQIVDSIPHYTQGSVSTTMVLTIEQFKWSMICCCNEIKTRVYKHQRQQSSQQGDNTSHPPDQHHFPSTAQALPPCPPTSFNKKSDKNKSRSSNNGNGNGSGHLFSSASHSCNSTSAIDAAAQDARTTLQALLMVMKSTLSVTTDKDHDGAKGPMDLGTQGYRGSPAVGPGPHHSQNLAMSHLTAGGVAISATGTAPPMRSHQLYHQPTHQLSRYSSHPTLSTAGIIPQSELSGNGNMASTLLRNRSQSRASNSTTVNNYVQATNSILNPLSIQELALLLAYLLSIAPDQWIPWHTYDFFIRPQGRTYKDLVEMLPTHSQRILKSLLETVEALIEYATSVGLQQQRIFFLQKQQAQEKQGAEKEKQNAKQQPSTTLAAHLRSKSDAESGHGWNNGSYGVGGSGGPMTKSAASSTLSLARALAILEPPLTAQELNHIQQKQKQQQQQQHAAVAQALGGGDTVHYEIAIRGRKRRVILDSLSGLVFRPRQNESHSHRLGGSGVGMGTMGVLMESSTEGGGAGLLSLPPNEERGPSSSGGKGKAMRRRSFLGSVTAPTSSTSGSGVVTAMGGGAPSSATVALQLQMSEREREAGHMAFENLFSAFEAEYVRPLPVASTMTKTAGATTSVEANAALQDELPNVTLPQSLLDAGSVARIRTSRSGANIGPEWPPTLPTAVQQGQQLPPRQTRSLPTAVSAPVGTDLAAMRSLSLPPWRKKHHSALQLGQHTPPLSSPSIASAARQEWLPQSHIAGETAPAGSTASTVSTNSSLESHVEETEMLQQQQEQQQSQTLVPPTSTSGSTTALPTVVQGYEVSIVAPRIPTDIGLRESRAESSPDVVTNEKDAAVSAGTSASTDIDKPLPTTFSTRTTETTRTRQHASAHKTRPMSLDNSQNETLGAQLSRSRTLSGTISSTWTTWKDHLLVMEEEEYVIADSSESPSVSSVSSYFSDSSYSDSGNEADERKGHGHDNEHDNDGHRQEGKDKRKRQGRRGGKRKEIETIIIPGGEGRRRTNKSSGTFGDLRTLVATIAAASQQQRAGSE